MQEEQVPAGCAGAPGVKVNLKPGPSQLRKQKQRPAQADEYSSAQKSNPSAPASTQKPASSWDHQARGPNLKGLLGWGSPEASFLSFPSSSGSWLHSEAIAKATPTHFIFLRGSDPDPAQATPWMLPGDYRERVKGPLLPERAGHPSFL